MYTTDRHHEEIAAAYRCLEKLLDDLWVETRPGTSRRTLCPHHAELSLQHVGPPMAALLQDALDDYSATVHRSVLTRGTTVTRAILRDLSEGRIGVRDQGCPVRGSQLQALPCTCYIPGQCERRFVLGSPPGNETLRPTASELAAEARRDAQRWLLDLEALMERLPTQLSLPAPQAPVSLPAPQAPVSLPAPPAWLALEAPRSIATGETPDLSYTLGDYAPFAQFGYTHGA